MSTDQQHAPAGHPAVAEQPTQPVPVAGPYPAQPAGPYAARPASPSAAHPAGPYAAHPGMPYTAPHPAPQSAGPAAERPWWAPGAPSAAATSAGPGGNLPPASPPGPEVARSDARRPRTPWLPLAGTAVVAALVASLATAGLTGAFEPEATSTTSPTTESSSSSTEQEPVEVPVAGSTVEQPDWTAVAAAVRESVVAIDVRTGQGSGEGSGVVIDDAGHILTNDHVVGDAVDGGLRVTLADGRVYEATLVGTDPTTDLAVIALTDPPEDLVAATIGDSEAVTVGEYVMAVGNPLGLDSTVTTGIVSALDRPVSTSEGQGAGVVVTNAIQVDAAINPGNSGGPLFDATGQVIGITSSIATLSGGSASGSIGLGFAIPSALAERIAAELIEDGSASHAFLGVTLGDGTATADGTTRLGAVVGEVSADSPAAAAGLRSEDVVVAIDGDAVSGAESLTASVREHAAGDEVTLTVVRGGKAVEVTATLAALDEVTAQNSSTEPQNPFGD